MTESIVPNCYRLPSAAQDWTQSWVRSVGIAAVIGSAYFLIAWLSIGLVVNETYSFLWPAAGIASGGLIALGPSARWPVAGGVMGAVMVLNLLKYGGIANAIAVTLVNMAEPLIVAGLIQRYIGVDFRLGGCVTCLVCLRRPSLAALRWRSGGPLSSNTAWHCRFWRLGATWSRTTRSGSSWWRHQ